MDATAVRGRVMFLILRALYGFHAVRLPLIDNHSQEQHAAFSLKTR